MKKIVFPLLVIAGIFAIYWFQFRSNNSPQAPKQQALTVSKHGAGFNTHIDSLLQTYFEIETAFVEADSLKAKEASIALVTYINRLNLDELKKDTTGIFESASMFLNDIKVNAESLGNQPMLNDMRQDFKNISENMYPLLKTIHYEGKILYWQNCPMAFGEDKGANWISNTAEILNPYLGKNHPEYKGTMLHCGEIKDSIKAQY